MMTNALRELNAGLQPQLTHVSILCRSVWKWQVLRVC